MQRIECIDRELKVSKLFFYDMFGIFVVQICEVDKSIRELFLKDVINVFLSFCAKDFLHYFSNNQLKNKRKIVTLSKNNPQKKKQEKNCIIIEFAINLLVVNGLVLSVS